MAVIFARRMIDDIMEDIPVFSTIAQWDLVKSTKIDTCAQICQHFLARDDALEPVFDDGQVVFPSMPDTPTSNRTRKLLIYQEFPSLGPLLRNVSSFIWIRDTLLKNGFNRFSTSTTSNTSTSMAT